MMHVTLRRRRQHDDGEHFVLPQHPPEVVDRAVQGRLCYFRDETMIEWMVVWVDGRMVGW